MGDFGKDLEAAHRKIAKLERELHEPAPAPRPPSSPRPFLGITIGAAAALIAVGAGFSLFLRAPHPSPKPELTVPVEVAPPMLHLRWTSALGRFPAAADASGDGTDEMLAILWNDARRDLPLWVVALDTTTFRPRWSAGPFPGQEGDRNTRLGIMEWHGGVVLLTDSQGGVHAIDLATGKRAGDFIVGPPVTGMCISEDRSGRVSFVRGYDEHVHVVLDLPTGFLNAKGLPTPDFQCYDSRRELLLCGKLNRGRPCISYAHLRGPASFVPAQTFETKDTLLTVGATSQRADAEPLERPAPFGVLADPKSRAPRWEGTLSLPDDRVHVGSDRSDFDGVDFVLGYQLVSGSFRVVARELAKGTVVWSADLAGSHEGSILYSLRMQSGFVFADIDGRLDVFRLEDGHRVASIRSLDIPLPDGQDAGLP